MSETQTLPKQSQDRQPGLESELKPRPSAKPTSPGRGKLAGKVALITGGDSGIGRATAYAFAAEGADVAIVYLNEQRDAEETRSEIEKDGRQCLFIPGDIGDETFCRKAVDSCVEKFGRIDVLVNNAAEQHVARKLEEISGEQLRRTFATNLFSMFYLTKAALPHMRNGSTVINSTSVTAYRGSPGLIDYASTKGAIVSFTRSLAKSIVNRGIRVNAVAPGPIWTPLIAASFSDEEVASLGSSVPMNRPGQPREVATCFVFLATDDSSYMTGQVLHPNGGEIVNT